jgi:hypothetical protein
LSEKTESRENLTLQIIIEIAELNCECCQNILPSFCDHSCFVDSWELKASLYYPTAIRNFPHIEDTKELLEQVINFGNSFCY